MAEFNWDDHPIVNESSKEESSFNWDDHPVVEAPKAKQEHISKGRSALIGAGQGATLGFGEEITAPFVATAGMVGSGVNRALGNEADTLPTLPDESTLEKFQRLMQQYRDVAREEQKSAQEQNPWSYGGGALVGGLLTPGMGGVGKIATAVKDASLATKIATGAGTGATIGGIAGAGEAEGNLSERIPGAVQGAKYGAILGAAIPAAGSLVSGAKKLAGFAKELPAAEELSNVYNRGIKGENLISKAGRQEAEDIVRNKFAAPLAADLKEQTSNYGKMIGNKIQEASDNGTKVDITDEVNNTLETLKEMKAKGSQESRANAKNIEDEIKGILGIKEPVEVNPEFANGPEGLINPKAKLIPETFEVDPKVAQELKQTLEDFSPKPGMKATELKSARTANELKGSVKGKLDAETGLADNQEIVNPDTGEITQGPSINKVFSDLKSATDRLKIDVSDLPNNIRDKITTQLASLEKSTVAGGNKREILKDVVAALKQADPEVAAKYEGPLTDAVERLELAQQTIGGGGRSGLIGTSKAAASTLANTAGLAVGKVGRASGLIPSAEQAAQEAAGNTSIAYKVAEKAGSFANTVLKSNAVKKGIITGETETSGTLRNIREAAPHEFQRQVASAAENADPDTLKSQAQNIRSQYGQQGEQLATILDNMSNKDKGARRALMFTILQNHAYRKMLGITGGKEE